MGNCFSGNSQHSVPEKIIKEVDTNPEKIIKEVDTNPEKIVKEVDTNNENQKHVDNGDEYSITKAETTSSTGFRIFTLDDLREATSGFAERNLLGEGGFGHVYKGRIEGLDVAVKKLNANGCQGHKEWLAEVEVLGRLHHPNLVQLIGISYDDDQLLLVYEYMSMGSLEDILCDDECVNLSWEMRLKIITGIAKGLAYLHKQTPPIIHRDLKPSNILLDSNYDAKLCDFGLARNGPTAERTHVSTRVMGTHAYVDPDYYCSGQLRLGSDVYGFGVVLLQLLTGRMPLVTSDSGHLTSIADWARPWLREKRRRRLLEIMDPRLHEYPFKAAWLAGHLADCCTGELPDRPKADTIEKFLINLSDIRKPSRNARRRTDEREGDGEGDGDGDGY